MVTASLIILIKNRTLKHELKTVSQEGPLKNSMYWLLVVHVAELLFLRKMRDNKGEINRDHWWVWIVMLLTYPYVLYVYYRTLIKTAHDSQQVVLSR